jgi:hypothetical protein
MPTSRPFSYNPSSLNLSGTYNIGTMCIGVETKLYIDNYGGLTWWNGPDEDLGYCIGTVVPAQNQSTPLGNIGNVKFWRTQAFTDAAFLILVQEVTGQTFVDTPSACAYLDLNNYWTSYNDLTRHYFVVQNRCSPERFRDVNGDRTRYYVTPDSFPAYNLYEKPYGNKDRNIWNVQLAQNNVGSPAKITNSFTPHQYTYKRGYWLTDVWVYKKGTTIVYSFPYGGTSTWGELLYKNIVNPYI